MLWACETVEFAPSLWSDVFVVGNQIIQKKVRVGRMEPLLGFYCFSWVLAKWSFWSQAQAEARLGWKSLMLVLQLLVVTIEDVYLVHVV